mmetsp:Transcript_64127/g.150310  ORF Transcript_64127/g.150310 Transcript_64127/m.150310 type:complete len:258 (-) Transcript_64127:1022-1795(-)
MASGSLLGVRDAVDDQDLRPPIHVLVLRLLQLHQCTQGQSEGDAIHGASPLLGLHFPVDEQVEASCHQAGCQGPKVVHDDHDRHTDHEAQSTTDKVQHTPAALVDPRGSPSCRVQPCQSEARQVHESICHQEAHGQEGCHELQLPDEHKKSSSQIGEQQRSGWLAGGTQRLQHTQGWHQPVLGHVLQKPWRHDQTLQRLAQRGQDDADEGRVGEGIPHNCLHDVPACLRRNTCTREPPSMMRLVAQEVTLQVLIRRH